MTGCRLSIAGYCDPHGENKLEDIKSARVSQYHVELDIKLGRRLT